MNRPDASLQRCLIQLNPHGYHWLQCAIPSTLSESMLAPKKHCKSYTKTMDAVSRNSFSILKSAQFLGRLTLKFTRVGSDLKKNCTAVSQLEFCIY